MAAYDALISLENKIESLKNVIYFRSDDSPYREALEFAHRGVECLKETSERMFLRSIHSLDREIRRAVRKFSDAVGEILSQCTNPDEIESTSVLHDLKQEIHSLIEALKKEEEQHIQELDKLLAEDEEADVVSSRIDFGGNNSKLVGISDQYDKLKHCLMSADDKCRVVALVGMAGIGKTALAKEIFEDPDTMERFDCRVWVTVGRKCRLNEFPRCILAQVNPDSDQMLAEGDEDTAQDFLKASLKGKRYLIVLDDVWNKYLAYYLQPDSFGTTALTADEKNGSRFLLTTRLQQAYPSGDEVDDNVLTMHLLNEEESWLLLREKVFAKELCPPQLEKAGRKIAEHCDGLPLTILTVANLLSKVDKNPQYWSDVATQKNHQLFRAAYDKISKVLLPSYRYLPRLLQMCFLYMGVFPQFYEIRGSKLINMFNVDGFLEQDMEKLSYLGADECLVELESNSLVIIRHNTMSSRNPIKSCRLHSSSWHLSNREAGKTKFSHVLNSRDDGLGEAVKSQCRLSFHNNILFGIKDVYKYVEDNCASTAHSLLCYGLYHQYQVPICFGLELLKVLDALSIRFYEFPMEVLQLVQLKYLALTLDGKLPTSISELSHLEFLIVNRHMNIKSCRAPTYLPVEIWNLKKLRHLQVMGSDLPDPCGASLENLLTLSKVSAHSCTEGILKAIPKLQKLGIRIEFAPDDDCKHLSCFDHIYCLENLTSLKCVIVNLEVVPRSSPISFFPFQLRKLSLNGLGYPWTEMNKIAALSNLEILHLRNYAFRGSEWKVKEEEFYSLYVLVIEDTDLVEWKIEHGSFPWLRSLSIKRCYKLAKIYGEFKRFLSKIELVDCNPLGVEQIKMAVGVRTKVSVHSSWDDGNLSP